MRIRSMLAVAALGLGGWSATAGAATTSLSIQDLLLQPDGKIVVIGEKLNCSVAGTAIDQLVPAMARFLPDGHLDRTFGIAGYAEISSGILAEEARFARRGDGGFWVPGLDQSFGPEIDEFSDDGKDILLRTPIYDERSEIQQAPTVASFVTAPDGKTGVSRIGCG